MSEQEDGAVERIGYTGTVSEHSATSRGESDIEARKAKRAELMAQTKRRQMEDVNALAEGAPDDLPAAIKDICTRPDVIGACQLLSAAQHLGITVRGTEGGGRELAAIARAHLAIVAGEAEKIVAANTRAEMARIEANAAKAEAEKFKAQAAASREAAKAAAEDAKAKEAAAREAEKKAGGA